METFMLVKSGSPIAVCGLSMTFTLAAHAQGSPVDAPRAYAAELISDTSLRSSFPADNSGQAGFENGKFVIRDAEKNNALNIGGVLQFRYSMDFRDDDVNDPDGDGEPNEDLNEDFTSGFSARRTRLRFTGSIWEKSLTYAVQIDASRSTGEVTILDAIGQYKWSNGVSVRWGQYKLPFLREQLVAFSHELTTDFSPSHDVFSLNRSQGVGMAYTAKTFRILGDFSDGSRASNTDFSSNTESDFALTARMEWIWAGDAFSRFEDFTSFRGQPFAAMLGAAAHYQTGGETGGIDASGAIDGTNDRDTFAATMDASFEGSGWNAFLAGTYRNDENDESANSQDYDDFGLLAQGGFFFSDQIEGFARYDVVLMDGDRSALPDGDDSFHSAAAGVNYYLSPGSHAAKFSGQINYFFNPTTDVEIVSAGTNIPLLVDSEDGQVSVVLQMQIMF